MKRGKEDKVSSWLHRERSLLDYKSLQIPRRITEPFSTKGNTRGPSKKTLHKGFVPNIPPHNSFGKPSCSNYEKLS
jgi:hypothetical protein